jgi:predicted dehydrogenase
MKQSNRRKFIKHSSLAAGAALTLPRAARAIGENEKVTVGIIGPGGMGSAHLGALCGNKAVNIAYVCDVDERRAAKARATVEKAKGKAPKVVSDMRRIFDDKSVDAVWIATPDHWHAPATILACDAGKHVYVEKPASHNLREGRLMVEAARRNKRVVQVGTQTRSSAGIREAMELLLDGAIGEVLVAKAWNSQRRGSIGKSKPGTPPAHLDFDTWLGPAPKVEFRPNMLHSIWRWWHDFGTGDMGNDGVHDIDLARWGLDVDTHPSKICAMGGKYFFDDDMQWPDTQNCLFEYAPDKGGRVKQLIFEMRIWSPYKQEGKENGNAFYGTKGIMTLGKKEGWKLYRERNQLVKQGGGGPDLGGHHRDFIDCIRNGKRPRADIETGHLSSSLCHLGNIAIRTGEMLHFDPAKERMLENAKADKLVRREYRKHWGTPKGV